MPTAYVYPVADGYINQGAPFPADGIHYTKVDDPYATPDDDATYILATPGQYEAWVPGTMPYVSGITSVQAWFRCKSVGPTTSALYSFLRIGGVNYEDSVGGFFGLSYGAHTNRLFNTNPAIGGAWDVAGLQSIQQYGFRIYGAATGLRATQCLLLINYTNAMPTVTTQAVTDIKARSATGNGTIVAIGSGAVTAHGVCWNKTGAPTIADDHTDEGAGLVGAFTSDMSGLDPDTTYYVRAYATNAIGTAYGLTVTFDTLEALITGLNPSMMELI